MVQLNAKLVGLQPYTLAATKVVDITATLCTMCLHTLGFATALSSNFIDNIRSAEVGVTQLWCRGPPSPPSHPQSCQTTRALSPWSSPLPRYALPPHLPPHGAWLGRLRSPPSRFLLHRAESETHVQPQTRTMCGNMLQVRFLSEPQLVAIRDCCACRRMMPSRFTTTSSTCRRFPAGVRPSDHLPRRSLPSPPRPSSESHPLQHGNNHATRLNFCVTYHCDGCYGTHCHVVCMQSGTLSRWHVLWTTRSCSTQSCMATSPGCVPQWACPHTHALPGPRRSGPVPISSSQAHNSETLLTCRALKLKPAVKQFRVP